MAKQDNSQAQDNGAGTISVSDLFAKANELMAVKAQVLAAIDENRKLLRGLAAQGFVHQADVDALYPPVKRGRGRKTADAEPETAAA